MEKSSPVELGLVALVNGKPPDTNNQFQPTQAHFRIAGALNDHEPTTSLDGLSEKAGISRATLSRALNDPTCLSWLVAQLPYALDRIMGGLVVKKKIW